MLGETGLLGTLSFFAIIELSLLCLKLFSIYRSIVDSCWDNRCNHCSTCKRNIYRYIWIKWVAIPLDPGCISDQAVRYNLRKRDMSKSNWMDSCWSILTLGIWVRTYRLDAACRLAFWRQADTNRYRATLSKMALIYFYPSQIVPGLNEHQLDNPNRYLSMNSALQRHVAVIL